MRRKDEVVIWPLYFDSTKTRSEGRRLPEKLSVPSPNIVLIEKAVKSLNLECEVIPEAAHPHFPWIKTGFILVKNKKRKSQILREVARELANFSV